MSTTEHQQTRLGEIKFSNGYPSTYTCAEQINVADIEAMQLEISGVIGMPVILLGFIDLNKREGKVTYRLLHKDSVIKCRSRSGRSELFYPVMELDDEFEVLGLWDGTCISSLLGVFNDLGISPNYDGIKNIYALQSKRIHGKKLKQKKVGVEEVKCVPYFLDQSGNSVLPCCESSPRWAEQNDVVTISHSVDDLTMAITDFLSSSGVYRKLVDRESKEYVQFKSRLQINSSWSVNPQLLSTSCATTDVERLPPEVIRDTLRVFAGGGYYTGASTYFHDAGLSVSDTHYHILFLIKNNLIEFEGDSSLSTGFPFNLINTAAGQQIAVKRLSKRMKRKTIEKLLATVIERAKQVDNIPFLKYKVKSIAVFGSFLNRENLSYGDLDLVVVIEKKKGGSYTDIKEHTNDEIADMYSGISLRMDKAWEMHVCEELGYRPPKSDRYGTTWWDEKAIKHHIKRSNHKISIHEKEEFDHLDTNDSLLVYEAK